MHGASLFSIRFVGKRARTGEPEVASPELLHGYVKENPDKLGDTDLESVRSWADHVVEGRFLIHKERKDGCLFTRTHSNTKQPPVYLVKGLTQPISELVPFLPCCADTRLLPFRGHIVTDGLISPLMVHIGRNMRGGFAEELKETLATRGLITTLPANATGADPSPLLTFFLGTAITRRASAKLIQALRQQSPELNLQYLLHITRVVHQGTVGNASDGSSSPTRAGSGNVDP